MRVPRGVPGPVRPPGLGPLLRLLFVQPLGIIARPAA